MVFEKNYLLSQFWADVNFISNLFSFENKAQKHYKFTKKLINNAIKKGKKGSMFFSKSENDNLRFWSKILSFSKIWQKLNPITDEATKRYTLLSQEDYQHFKLEEVKSFFSYFFEVKANDRFLRNLQYEKLFSMNQALQNTVRSWNSIDFLNNKNFVEYKLSPKVLNWTKNDYKFKNQIKEDKEEEEQRSQKEDFVKELFNVFDLSDNLDIFDDKQREVKMPVFDYEETVERSSDYVPWYQEEKRKKEEEKNKKEKQNST